MMLHGHQQPVAESSSRARLQDTKVQYSTYQQNSASILFCTEKLSVHEDSIELAITPVETDGRRY
jgi:hypothetical protein